MDILYPQPVIVVANYPDNKSFIVESLP